MNLIMLFGTIEINRSKKLAKKVKKRPQDQGLTSKDKKLIASFEGKKINRYHLINNLLSRAQIQRGVLNAIMEVGKQDKNDDPGNYLDELDKREKD